MSVFSSIPVRSNGQTVDVSWWNTIRTALISFAGAGLVDESQATIADAQGTYQSVSGLSFDHSLVRAVDIEYTIYREDGTTSRRERGTLRAMYKAREGTWGYERQSYGDDALGNGTVSSPLIVNSSGQVQYKSDSIGGTYVGSMRFKVVTSFAKES